jgi:hypothetical protein
MRQLHQTGETIDHGSQEIPLDKIVCSVSRYRDFTRSFLPKRRSNQERWAGLRAAMDEMVGLSPIEVYQIEMLVLSRMETPSLISRGIGSETITAYVTEIKTRVPFSAIDDPNELICKASYADFLQ